MNTSKRYSPEIRERAVRPFERFEAQLKGAVAPETGRTFRANACQKAAYYATRLAGAPPLSRGNAPVDTLSLPEMKELQQLLVRRGFDVGKIDGVVGASTRDAIRTMQIKYGLPADGYPSAELLDRLRSG